MIYKLCRKCKKPITHPNVYCNKCTDIVLEQKEEFERLRNRKYNKNRDPKYKKFYNSVSWIILKEKKMQDVNYRCEKCNALATEVHHKKPIQTEEGWELRLDYNNLEACCFECHNLNHNRFQKKGRKK